MDWKTETEQVERAEALRRIQEMAKSQNINGSFKVFYEGDLVVSPEDLPTTVDLSKVQVSGVLNNA